MTSYSYSCASGQCAASITTETETCTRNTNGNPCGTSTYGGWGSCSGFSDTCDETGTQSRTATVYTCSSGQCMASTNTEFQGCMRSTAGVQCRAGNTCDYPEYCSGGSCPADAQMPAGTSCNDNDPGTSGDVCDGAGGCAGEPSGCPSMTMTWSQVQPAWGGNPAAGGEYSCSGVVDAASHGSIGTATQNSSERTGLARFTCNRGTWIPIDSTRTCDGKLISTQAEVTCFDGSPAHSLVISWYTDDLRRCADRGGVTFWVGQILAAYGDPNNPCFAASNKETCVRNGFRNSARATGEFPPTGDNPFPHVSLQMERLLCGPSDRYVYAHTGFADGVPDSTGRVGNYCKSRR